jgi:hypothetical protein
MIFIVKFRCVSSVKAVVKAVPAGFAQANFAGD